MAETPSTPNRKPAAARSGSRARSGTAASSGSRARNGTAARTTAGKAEKARSTAIARRTTAARRTRAAAESDVRAARATIVEGRAFAARAALVSVGATLTARDRVIGAATGLARATSPAAAERALTRRRKAFPAELMRLERRGSRAQKGLERGARRFGSRVERDVRGLVTMARGQLIRT